MPQPKLTVEGRRAVAGALSSAFGPPRPVTSGFANIAIPAEPLVEFPHLLAAATIVDILLFYSQKDASPQAILAFTKTPRRELPYEKNLIGDFFLIVEKITHPILNNAGSPDILASSFEQKATLPPLWKSAIGLLAEEASALMQKAIGAQGKNFQSQFNLLLGLLRILPDALIENSNFDRMSTTDKGNKFQFALVESISKEIVYSVIKGNLDLARFIAGTTPTIDTSKSINLAPIRSKHRDQNKVEHYFQCLIGFAAAHEIAISSSRSLLSFHYLQNLQPKTDLIGTLDHPKPRLPIQYAVILKNYAGQKRDKHVLYSGINGGRGIVFGITDPDAPEPRLDFHLAGEESARVNIHKLCPMNYERNTFECPSPAVSQTLIPTNAKVYSLLEDVQSHILGCFSFAPKLFLGERLSDSSLVIIERARIVIGLPPNMKPPAEAGFRYLRLDEGKTDRVVSGLGMSNALALNYFALIPLDSRTFSPYSRNLDDALDQVLYTHWSGNFDELFQAIKSCGGYFSTIRDAYIFRGEFAGEVLTRKELDACGSKSEKMTCLCNFLATVKVDPELFIISFLQKKHQWLE